MAGWILVGVSGFVGDASVERQAAAPCCRSHSMSDVHGGESRGHTVALQPVYLNMAELAGLKWEPP